ncbi:hypothetical protein LR48_Vigan477s001200 [Vigna angularis]|uniref:Secreted protein n=1 Tax=Phaseolus angularis TaxID=3914 RepID=A0A0L9TBL1_PHAAN|nr:hypothetical protein LR48_Vigan477s001200 [Vigna angularis]
MLCTWNMQLTITLKFTSVLCYLAPPPASFPFGKPTELEIYQNIHSNTTRQFHKTLEYAPNLHCFLSSAASSLSSGVSSEHPEVASIIWHQEPDIPLTLKS